ncbi:sacsin N-terminal ATP-binding-like domain-containing protein [Oleidesulfovibrio sp.]|uniref:sacsin N-terminal ATP-binding-like domain-containing protein n=1 Tax=Oleidesulfovibrio sp. TaxID=2909707 RepID=UPI003A856815
MTSTIQDLTEKRQRWVDANRENNFENGIKRLLTELYPDNAHFIYELLQNAEDARAGVVRFTMSNEAIEFEHNGKRLFDIKDVDSITSIGVSTKRDDPTSIGKFGVGFKAVFAYTNTPEIHSGNFHFRIQDLVVPITHDIKKTAPRDKNTHFIFPFNHPAKQPAKAVAEISHGLRALENNALLFLSHIHLIEYLLSDGSLGILERIDHKNGHIEIKASHPKGEETVSHWLRYQKSVEVTDEDGKAITCQIAVAYSLQQSEKNKSQPKWKIVPLDRGQVSIYFPAEKETSNLRFHIHAPFASTVARDSVRDCEANNQLRDNIAKLVVESLADIRDRGMLTVGFLTALPNQVDNLAPFYEPIREAIVHAFQTEALTPTRSKSHAPSQTLYRGPAKISEIINDENLSLLTNHTPPLWAANPPQQNQREDRFLDSLKIDSWGWKDLCESLTCCNDDKQKTIEAWIAKKDDAWLIRFYALLGEARDEHYKYINVANMQIVRVETSQGDIHVLPQEAFFPPEGSVPPRNIHLVKSAVYNVGRSDPQKKYAASFLSSSGVRQFDARVIIELKLRRYSSPPKEVPNGYYKDLAEFIDYSKKFPTNLELFKKYRFLFHETSGGTPHWLEPTQFCLDSPYSQTGLAALTAIHKKYALLASYKDNFPESKLFDFIDFLKAVGVMHTLKVRNAPLWKNPNNSSLYPVSSYRETDTRISVDYSIDSLSEYTDLQSVSASRLIWNALICAEPKVAKARYRPNQQYGIRDADSQLVCHLKTCAWIPDSSGAFHKPQDMTRENLRTDFPYDDRNGLLTAIGFGEHAQQRSEEYRAKNRDAQKIGFESADEAKKMVQLAQLLKNSGKSPDDLLRQLQPAPKQERPTFPRSSVVNPERRQERLEAELVNALKKKFEKRERSVRTTSSAIAPITQLRAQYTNEDDQMVCQICKEEMPFRKRNGMHYFEKKEMLSSEHFSEEHEAQYLALCPVCAAKYQEFVKSDANAMFKLKEAILNTNNSEFSIFLGNEQASITFVEKHLQDLKTILIYNKSTGAF